MKWTLIFKLSLFGLAMAIGTISWISMKIEPVFWLVIFIICAYYIAKYAPGKYFLHGFLVSMVNSIWITAVHILFYSNYIAHHPDMQSMNANMPMQDNPRLMMLIVGPLFGAVSGLVLGLFAWIASRMVKKQPVTR